MSDEVCNPHRILWEKWRDPFIAAVKEHREKGWHDGYEYLEKPSQVGAYGGPFMYGPAGIIPLNELNSPSKTFNLWVGHASFPIDRKVCDRMKTVPGVEILRVWSRYRFWLGIAKAFDEATVKCAVLRASRPERALTTTTTLAPPATSNAASRLQAFLAKRHKFWAVIQTKDGKLSPVGGEDREQVERAIADNQQAKHVVTSWDRGINGQA